MSPALQVDKIKELRQELRRVKYNNKFAATLFNTVGTLVVVAAAAILVANLWLPILQVTGTSMSPTLQEGQVLMASKGHDFKTGDVIAFYYNNKILVKRVIAMPGDWVNISDDGTVYVNDIAIDEPYLKEKALGDCNIELPYQVPESKIFVMGDNRSVSLDSRNTAIGCVSEEQVVGKITFAIKPAHDSLLLIIPPDDIMLHRSCCHRPRHRAKYLKKSIHHTDTFIAGAFI